MICFRSNHSTLRESFKDIAPINHLDYAAYQNDLDYDLLQVKGVTGTITNKTTIADLKLFGRSYYNSLTTSPLSKEHYISIQNLTFA